MPTTCSYMYNWSKLAPGLQDISSYSIPIIRVTSLCVQNSVVSIKILQLYSYRVAFLMSLRDTLYLLQMVVNCQWKRCTREHCRK